MTREPVFGRAAPSSMGSSWRFTGLAALVAVTLLLGGARSAQASCNSASCTSTAPNQCVSGTCYGETCSGYPGGYCPAGQYCNNCGTYVSCSGTAGVCATPGLPFSAGSIVIPMDDCYNQDYNANPSPMTTTAGCAAGPTQSCYASSGYPSGNVRLPFGLIYLLAENNIPVSVILNPTKVSLNSSDFSVTPPAGSTTEVATFLKRSGAGYVTAPGYVTAGTGTINYWGMPFVIDAPYAAQALAVIAAYSSASSGFFDTVPIHVINYPFSAPVAAVLGSRPKPVIIDGSPLDTYFSESGITSVVPSGSTYLLLNGTAPSYTFTWPSAVLGANPACPGDVCSALTWTDSDGTTSRIADVLWAHVDAVNSWPAIPPFYQQGGTTMAVATATWDSGAGGGIGGGIHDDGSSAIKGPFCATLATGSASLTAFPGPPTDFPASNIFLQIGNMNLFVHGGGGGTSNFQFTSDPAAHTAALTNGSDYTVIAGHPVVGGAQQPGDLVYLGSLNSWHGGSTGKDAGLRIMYNTLLAGGNGIPAPMVATELSRSSPVSQRTGQTYLGTFDWKIPKYPTMGGNSLYAPDKTVYPYVTGHFREYTGPAGTTTIACDPTQSGAPCTWDAARQIKPWSQRNVFVGEVSGSNATMVPVTTASSPLATDATIQFIAGHIGQKLGGVDYSTAAVIEAKGNLSQVTVPGAQTRPTIAYVGARDGMLHAFCAQPTCYGSYAAGDELWAFIPPAVKTAMDGALTSSDWSSINVGGTIRVGDFNGVFGYPGATNLNSSGYRTILIMGTRETGTVIALDISNPDPSKVNQDGFRFLWSQDGTYVATGVTPYAMGKTLGAALGLNESTGYAAVTSAISDSTGANSGENYYLMQLTDGKVMQTTQHLYTRRAPLVGGSTGMIPNDAPPLPVIVDADADGFDETILTTDLEGHLAKTVIKSGFAIDSAHSGTLFDASASCTTGVACQPIGASTALAVHGGSNVIGAFVVTGGADWARSATQQSYVYGVDVGQPSQTVSLTAPFFTSALGTVTMPAGPPPANLPLAFPLRSYAQPTVAGTDLFVVGTALALGDTTQLSVPSIYPGTYGQVLRFGGLDSTLSTTAFLYINQGTNFGGGLGSVMETNSTSASGSLTVMGTNQALRVALPSGSSSLANGQYAVETPAKPGSRNFAMMTWFDLSP